MSIDSTFFLLFINFIILLVILRKFLFRPFLENFEKRERLTKGYLKKAEDDERLAEDKLEEYKRIIHLTKNETSEDLARVQKEAIERQREIVDSATLKSRNIMEKAKTEIIEATSQAKKELIEKTKRFSAEIAEKILGRKL
jgi:F-type H+-transporting ATPase subunit b